MVCECMEKTENGDICHSNDGCEYQLFGTFDDPIFCGEQEIRDIVLDTPQNPSEDPADDGYSGNT